MDAGIRSSPPKVLEAPLNHASGIVRLPFSSVHLPGACSVNGLWLDGRRSGCPVFPSRCVRFVIGGDPEDDRPGVSLFLRPSGRPVVGVGVFDRSAFISSFALLIPG